MLAIVQKIGDVMHGLTPQDNISTLKRTVGGIDTLSYTIYPQSEAFNTATERMTEVAALDKQIDEEVFRGRVLSISGKSSGSTSQTITCESAAARLKDSCYNGSVTRTEVLRVALNRILTAHNDLTDDAGKVYLGDCTETIVELTKSFDYVTTLNVINEVVADAGLEWRIRYDDVNDRYKLDVAAFFGGVATEPIVIGSNLGSIRYTTDPSGVATRIIPLGGIGYNGERLTIRTYGGRDSIYIDRSDLTAKYGVITRTVIHDDIACDDPATFGTKVSELYSAGVADAQALADKAVTWEVSAVDLARAGYNVDTFRIGYYYHIMHPLLGADVTLRLVEMVTDYRNPQKSKLTFGDKAATLTASVTLAANTAAARATAQVINLTQIVESRTGGTWLTEMTKSEYTGMQSHDPNTLYIISDTAELYLGDAPISGGGGGGGSDDNYSYNEAAVGAWVDGTIIYKKTVHLTDLTGDARYEFTTSAGYHFTNLIKVDIMSSYVDNTYNYQWAGYSGNNRAVANTFLDKNNNVVHVYFYNPYYISEAYLTFYYTKVADS